MKKIKEMYGVAIVKPWSKEMYDHNDKVAEEIKATIFSKWLLAYSDAELEYDAEELDFRMTSPDEDFISEGFEFREWEYCASDEMIDIQKAITLYSIGSGYTISDIEEKLKNELEHAPYYRLKEMAEDLKIELKEELIGLS
jgi:hypothetical protein